MSYAYPPQTAYHPPPFGGAPPSPFYGAPPYALSRPPGPPLPQRGPPLMLSSNSLSPPHMGVPSHPHSSPALPHMGVPPHQHPLAPPPHMGGPPHQHPSAAPPHMGGPPHQHPPAAPPHMGGPPHQHPPAPSGLQGGYARLASASQIPQAVAPPPGANTATYDPNLPAGTMVVTTTVTEYNLVPDGRQPQGPRPPALSTPNLGHPGPPMGPAAPMTSSHSLTSHHLPPPVSSTLSYGSNELPSVQRVCGQCQTQIQPNEVFLQAEGRDYHARCFRCARCFVCIDHQRYKRSERGEIFCVLCGSPKCVRCQGAITNPEVLNTQGLAYHPECFTCVACFYPIRGEYVGDATQPRCLRCGLPKCQQCQRTIQTGERYALTNGRLLCTYCDSSQHLNYQVFQPIPATPTAQTYTTYKYNEPPGWAPHLGGC
eukprot:GEMP01011665.1.p1 GENE.GEMP01011665.1~~GEMP01011665.1.p1  ORF type:complete len:427 (+),score=79.12 GEMP01011665.1:126-1406(+)